MFTRMVEARRRKRWREAMLEAIDLASDRRGYSMYVKNPTRSAGLRCIRVFEQVNDCKFDPFNNSHVSKVSGMARFGEPFYWLKKRGLI